jgi:hypothetical protein
VYQGIGPEEAAMRRCRAALTALLLALCSLLVAGPASAGGPTSALLVLPGTGSTASLYTGEADYEALARLVGAFEGDGGASGRVDGSGTSHEKGTGVTVTWLIHDVQVWRVDRIYLGADGGPWISTQAVMGGGGSVWDSPVVWHTAADGPALTALLDRLGLGPSAVTAGTAGAPDAAGAAGATARDAAPAQEAAGDRTAADRPTGAESSSPAWAWGLAGLAAGAALVLASTRLMRRRDRTAPEAVPDWPVPDVLSSAPRR